MSELKNRRLAALLFADIAGYTAIMQKDEPKASKILDRFQKVMEKKVAIFEGQIVNFYGDGALCVFQNPLAAMQCAIDIQSDFREAPKVPLRIGIHSGMAVFEKGKVYGDSVNIASRIESMGVPGSILFSKRVRNELKNQPNLNMISLGSFGFKNVEEPMEVFALVNEGLSVPKKQELRGKVKPAKTIFDRSFVKIGLVISVVFLLGFLLWKSLLNNTSTEGELPVAEDLSIAVLPLSNLNNNPEEDYVSNGISMEIINALTQVPDLKVMGRSTSFSYKGKDLPIPEIAKDLKVQYVLEGTFRKIGERVKVFVQLINATDGFNKWSESYDRPNEDIFDIQNEIVQSILEALEITSNEKERPVWDRHQPQNMEAYEQYLKGLHFMDLRITGAEKANALFKDVIKLDPDFAPAYVGLGFTYIRLGFDGFIPREQGEKEAKKAAFQALKLDPELAEAYILLARITGWYNRNWLEARPHLEKALSLNPRLPDVYKELGNMKESFGDFDGALKDNLKAVSLDPLNPRIELSLSVIYMLNREYDNALKEAQSILEMYPDYSDAFRVKGDVYFCMGEYEKSIEFYQKALDFSGGKVNEYFITLAEALTGKPEKATQSLGAFDDLGRSISALNITKGSLFASLGQLDSAFHYVEKAAEAEEIYIYYYDRMPFLKPLWEDPRLGEIMNRYALEN